jgi:hypothetical protein
MRNNLANNSTVADQQLVRNANNSDFLSMPVLTTKDFHYVTEQGGHATHAPKIGSIHRIRPGYSQFSPPLILG